jgi:hypothetical protein
MNFLPSGSTAAPLEESLVDPVSYQNVLAGQILALSLSVGFDANDPDFSSSDVALSNLVLGSGEFQGFTVAEMLSLANDVLGGCSNLYEASSINAVISSINENFVDGTNDNGFLDCPDQETVICSLELISETSECLADGSYVLTLDLEGSNGSFILQSDNALQGNGSTFCFPAPADSASSYSTSIELLFAAEEDYSYEIVQTNEPACSPISNNSCGVDQTTGSAPDCCELDVNCPSFDHPTYTCIDDLPSPNPDAIEVTSSCGNPIISITEDSDGNGCFNDALIINRTYYITVESITETCTETIRLVDSIPPVITCPDTQIASCDSTTILPIEMATAVDNCDNELEITYNDILPASCSGFFRLWTAVDDCGNISTCIQQVLLSDDSPPTILAPDDIEIECNANTDPQYTGTASASDYCSEVALSYSDESSPTLSCTEIITRTWVAIDACGNSSSVQQIISRIDLTGPVIYNVPPGTNLQCGDVPEPANAIAVDACSGDTLEVTLTENISQNGCRTMVQRTYTAIDSCGNASSLSRNIIIEDTQGPALTCPADYFLNCGDNAYGPDEIGYPEVSDNCSGSDVSLSFQDSDLNMNTCPAEILRHWTAIDTCGNASDCIQRIYFLDTSPPSITCPEDITVDCSAGGSIDPLFTGSATATDECTTVTISYNDGPLTGDCPKTFLRTWIAMDACFNVSTCQQSIEIIDDAAPQMTCPPDISISCAYAGADPAVTGSPQVYDGCLSFELSYSDGPIEGDCPKQFVRTWTATDECGNASTCQQSISLEDTMVPVITCPNDVELSCGSDTDPAITGTATAIDFCNNVDVSYFDYEISTDCGIELIRHWTATDLCGNSSSCNQTISFSTVESPIIDCPADIEVTCGGDIDPSITGYPEVEVSCGTVTITYTDSISDVIGNGSDSLLCGQLRTQTQGGWGTIASGNNPGTYRDLHFDEAFPNGLTVGCEYTLTLSSSEAVANFLPSGGTGVVINQDYLDPTSLGNVLAGQLVALTLSVGFDEADPSFGEAEIALGEMLIGSGQFTDYTVNEVLMIANQVFGGCESLYSASDMIHVLSEINENYVDGSSNNGFLECPEAGVNPETCVIIRTWTIIFACQDTSYCTQTIFGSYSNLESPEPELLRLAGISVYPSPTSGMIRVDASALASDGDMINVLTLEGDLLREYRYKGEEEGLFLDLGTLSAGIYLIQWNGAKIQASTRVVKY